MNLRIILGMPCENVRIKFSIFERDDLFLQVTGRSVDHLECFNDAAGRLQECSKYSYFKA